MDSIGPLSLAGGLTELAKVNSSNVAAFDNVAWLPTLLPRYLSLDCDCIKCTKCSYVPEIVSGLFEDASKVNMKKFSNF